MWLGLVGLFKGDNLKSTLITIAALLLGFALLGSVAYAGYAWHARGEEKRTADLKEAMREVFDKEKADLLATYKRADDIDRTLTEMKTSLAANFGEQKSDIGKLRKQFKEVYDVVIPPEGVEQWERSRDMYNKAARQRSSQ